MKTRAQRRREALPDKVDEKKLTKKQILDRKRQGSKIKGQPEGKKKVKVNPSPEPAPKTSKRGRPPTVRVTEPPKEKSKSYQKKEDSDDMKNTNRRSSTRKVPSDDKSQSKDKEKSKDKKKEQVKGRPSKKTGDKEPAKKSGQSESKQQIKKIQFKGKIPIDSHFPQVSNPNLMVLEHLGKVYSATLNQTSVQNNNNKFYILQIIQDSKNPQNCYFYTRWGRVGVAGQISCTPAININHAIAQYNAKYSQKHRKGNYREVQLNYEAEDAAKQKQKDSKKEEQQNQKDKQKAFKESKLSKPVKRLMELIFDLNMMKKQMFEIGFNVNKMPLGKLSKDNIKLGFTILQKLMDEIKGKNRKDTISQLTNDFYSYIPHDFGFSKMIHHILDDVQKVKKKIQMLESLAEIKLATTLISGDKEDENQLDSNYKKLNRDIKAVQKNTELFQLMDRYLQSTHAKTHGGYNLELEDLFELNCEAQNARYTKEIDNKMLLWHGSRLTNFVGILSQGLRIAPPEAPVTGYMFGKGVYFADMSSKSANYCFTSRDNNTGILLLCEAALGDMNEKLHADYYAANLPAGKKSTMGVGRTSPKPENAVKMSDGVVVPMGPGEPSGRDAATLLYNQFIVYDVAQVKIKYLLRTKFNYKNDGYGYPF